MITRGQMKKMADAEKTEMEVSVVPPTFRGTSSEDVKRFLKDFDRAARVNRWTATTKMINLPCYLRGPAADWFDRNEGTLETYARAATGLQEAFKKSGEDLEAHGALLSRRQGPDEEASTYVHDVLRLCYECGDMREAEKVRHVLRGLQPRILEKVALMDNQDLASLTNNIRKIEGTFSLLAQRRAEVDGGAMSNLALEVSRLQREIQNLKLQGEFSKTPNYVPNERVGRNDGRQQDARPNDRGGGPPQRSGGRSVCYRCGRPGHYARDCRQSGNGR